MQTELSDSLKKFKMLVEKDLSNLAFAWSMVNKEHGDLLVDALLLEKPIAAKRFRKVGTVVRLLEKIMSCPGLHLQLDHIAEEVLRSCRKKLNPPHIPYLKWELAYIAGFSDIRRGCAILGYKHKRTPQRRDHTMQIGKYIQELGDSGAYKEVLDRFGYISKEGISFFVRKTTRGPEALPSVPLLPSGYRSARAVSNYVRLCTEVFLEGKRERSAERNRMADYRNLYFDIIKGHDKADLVHKLPRHMEKEQLWVLQEVYGPVYHDAIETWGLKGQKLEDLYAYAISIPYAVSAILTGEPGDLIAEYVKTHGKRPPSSFFPSKQAIRTLLPHISKLMPAESSFRMTSIRNLRFANSNSNIVHFSGTSFLKRTAGLRGIVDMRSEYAKNQKIEASDLEKHSWILDDKDTAILKAYYVDGESNQRMLGKKLGITQGAVSHRLVSARLKIEISEIIGGVPTMAEIDQYSNFINAARFNKSRKGMTVSPKDPGGTEPKRVITLSEFVATVVSLGGKQTAIAKALGIGQPTVSVSVKRLHDLQESTTPPDSCKRVAAYIKYLARFPYAFQSVHLPHFEWKEGVVGKILKTKKRKKV